MNSTKKDIRALSKEELRAFFASQGDQAFRGTQVYEWLWQKGAHHFEDMTNLSKTLVKCWMKILVLIISK